jgi:hypothetical protein
MRSRRRGMLSRVRTIRSAVVLTAAASLGLTVGVATPAQAATANVWIVVDNRNCVGGGTVIGVWGAVDWVWSGGDWGDNVLYPRAELYRTNTFSGRAYCQRPWYRGGDYWINVTWKQFYPTRSGQTFWF